MKDMYLHIALAILQIIFIFSPIPKRRDHKQYATVIIRIIFFAGIAYSAFFDGLEPTPYDIYVNIPCFLIIFILPRFRGFK